jgi:molybdopterin molybdotransferase
MDLKRVYEFLSSWCAQVSWQVDVEHVALSDAVGRTLAQDVLSPENIPRFPRAMMDGVAVEGRRLEAVAAENAAEIAILVRPELDPTERGDAAEVNRVGDELIARPVVTGGRVDLPLDSVIPWEQLLDAAGTPLNSLPDVGVFRLRDPARFRTSQHVAMVGEDVRQGSWLWHSGRIVRPHDLGLAAAIGLDSLPCQRMPRVRLVLTGSEVAHVRCPPIGDQIRDANTPVLTALVQRDGGCVEEVLRVGDSPSDWTDELLRPGVDLIVMSGGTSAGPQDHAARFVRSTGRLEFHGLPLRPGRPVGIGSCKSALVFLLPGNPIACQFTYDLFVRCALQMLRRAPIQWPYRCQLARLSEPVQSVAGRLDYLRLNRVNRMIVRGQGDPTDDAARSMVPMMEKPTRHSEVDAVKGQGTPSPGWELPATEPTLSDDILVRPVTSGRASNLTTVTSADGFVLIPPEKEWLDADQRVRVYWYD